MLDQNRQYEMTIRPLGRKSADEYYHEGAIWIEGREGNTYTVDIRNNTYQRALFVVSVDGLDVLDGKPAGLDSRGYVLNGYQTISIPGWALDNQEAAKFFFSRGQSSYVNAIGGSTTNTGVIGGMVFTEQVPQYNYTNLNPQLSPFNIAAYYSGNGSVNHNSRQYGSINSASLSATLLGGATPDMVGGGAPPMGRGSTCSASGDTVQMSMNAALPQNSVMAASMSPSPVSQEIGTGFGEATDWKTVDVNFIKAYPQHPSAILAIYYNTARNLEKMGIALRKRHDVSHKANPFPNYNSPVKGCKPPRNWNG